MSDIIANRYELGPVVGTGGMSEVYQATDTLLGREVAIKVLRQDLARDVNFRERFRKEAHNAGRLNHPAIVAVYDTGETERDGISTPYIVMELVNGRNLRDIVREGGPLSPEEAATTLIPVCEALQASHDAGIVHRDIKPANVMITNTGVVKIMDFGIARALDDATSAMTQTSAVIGTAQYLSPEQARGKAVDGRSDIYALGCVMYDIITGRPPFEGETPFAVAYQHVQEDPTPPSDFIPDLSPTAALNVNAVVLTAMAKHPGDRYQTATDMAEDLKRLERNAVTMAARHYIEPSDYEDEVEEHAVEAAPTTQMFSPATVAAPAQEEVYEPEPPRRLGLKILVGTLALASLGIVGAFTYEYFTGGQNSGFGLNKQLIELPDYAGYTREAAASDLAAKGLQVQISEEANPTVERGDVIRTNPAAGSSIQSGTTVTLFVSSGKEVTEVPDLTGKSTAEANNILNAAGLELDSVVREDSSDKVEEGKIMEQTPSAGSQVSKGSKVTITVSMGVAKERVPVVTGMLWSQAEGNLTSLGFEPVVEVIDHTAPEGTVVEVAGEGTQVDARSRITVRISNGQMITMPDLVGLNMTAAVKALHDAGWKGQANQIALGDPLKTSSLVDGGRVAVQVQPAGSHIRKDSAIAVSLWEFDIASLAP
ncbi:Stk1 family PASTA domain-containing Ser/Thr kinase [Corynebacterium felinum]|uniref:non-specific serine/threonine protein kinase n=2 Tax=Corynebacterium felinum TaxID=131318 RepID=A0ABU2B7P9_9CORY|nr:Stk1 family PASTA domain-containing Ser/Thr kinase [Corynebacterium felinum]MDF5819561.1 Stk1 family PASTA domain-containing Ser/Thr kinase [Corynebacterium felinum]MDR7354311.1 serine/threonine-protein kinase [Corynebacterium felinum]WJY93688.1 Serine/threonine-protein kinase PknB [Corynebacterium felinum]